jgi:CP family cyanate transporter-like MFS transporter
MRSLLGDCLAWQVTLFFGLQAAIVFSGLSWLPSVLRSDGYGASSAGLLLALYALGGVPASIGVPLIATRSGNQRLLVAGCAAFEAAALAGLATAPAVAPAWVGLFALGQGASFSLAVTLIGLRSRDARQSADLSGMAQAIGYAIAAAGAFAVGILHAAAGNWTIPLLFLTALCLPMAMIGARAGRAELIGDRRRTRNTAPTVPPVGRQEPGQRSSVSSELGRVLQTRIRPSGGGSSGSVW